ncbi:hypothetical protein V8E52_007319 [Russula decolorans]
MHQYKTVAQILLILSIFNLVFAAPVVREIYDAHDDVVVPVVVRNVATMSKERRQSESDESPSHLPRLRQMGRHPRILRRRRRRTGRRLQVCRARRRQTSRNRSLCTNRHHLQEDQPLWPFRRRQGGRHLCPLYRRRTSRCLCTRHRRLSIIQR